VVPSANNAMLCQGRPVACPQIATLSVTAAMAMPTRSIRCQSRAPSTLSAGGRVVPGNQDRGDAHGATGGDGPGRSFARRIQDRDEAQQPQSPLQPRGGHVLLAAQRAIRLGDGQYPEAILGVSLAPHRGAGHQVRCVVEHRGAQHYFGGTLDENAHLAVREAVHGGHASAGAVEWHFRAPRELRRERVSVEPELACRSEQRRLGGIAKRSPGRHLPGWGAQRGVVAQGGGHKQLGDIRRVAGRQDVTGPDDVAVRGIALAADRGLTRHGSQ
jgi:hypothetical protein